MTVMSPLALAKRTTLAAAERRNATMGSASPGVGWSIRTAFSDRPRPLFEELGLGRVEVERTYTWV